MTDGDLRWEVLTYAFGHGISIDQAITEMAAEDAEGFEAES